MTTLRHSLIDAQNRLAAGHGQLPAAEARIEAQMLMRRALGDVSRAWLIAHELDNLSPVQIDVFSALLQRRLDGEPVAYILGEREFFGLSLKLTPEVLIPRPDTETLVEAALARIPADAACRVLDLGTGSGAIALAIASQRPRSRVTGVDRSAGAVAVASENARRLQIDNADFLPSDWFDALNDAEYDVIVSNPPYIAEDDPHLTQGDLRHEPMTALASGHDGLDDIRRIVGAVPGHLARGGWLLFEHGYDQSERVQRLLQDSGFAEVESVADLAGIARVTLGRRA